MFCFSSSWGSWGWCHFGSWSDAQIHVSICTVFSPPSHSWHLTMQPLSWEVFGHLPCRRVGSFSIKAKLSLCSLLSSNLGVFISLNKIWVIFISWNTTNSHSKALLSLPQTCWSSFFPSIYFCPWSSAQSCIYQIHLLPLLHPIKLQGPINGIKWPPWSTITFLEDKNLFICFFFWWWQHLGPKLLLSPSHRHRTFALKSGLDNEGSYCSWLWMSWPSSWQVTTHELCKKPKRWAKTS